jgi:HPt (histidine-containing phosphotransfer) domain-containing protein
MSERPLVDFSYLHELAGDKPDYINQVLTLFMDSTVPGLKDLDNLINNTSKWDAISKQAHALKSGVGVVKIEGMLERLQKIESLAREKKDKPQIKKSFEEIMETFTLAEPIIRERMYPIPPPAEE